MVTEILYSTWRMHSLVNQFRARLLMTCVVNEGSECACCHNLKLELEFVIQELSSAREIIRMLREDGNTEPVHETVLQDDHQEDPYNPQSDSDG